MGIPEESGNAPHLRLVVDNAAPRGGLIPLLDLERRLDETERTLRRPGLAPETREALLEARALLRCELEARPFNLRLARRCEQRLRWIERRLPDGMTGTPVGLLERARRTLTAILPTPMARA